MSPAPRTATYAARPESSRGRRYPEPPPRYRSEYQRDRDRVLHSNAFRRLMHKTQVFVYDEGDLYRTRLTHSLEVAQIARSAARALALDEDLTEAIALAHDLGHTPFGHAGQDALNATMRDYGGFEHNLQSLRVVDELEEKYPEFPGLNLTFETREGILKHCSLNNARQLGDVGERFLKRLQPGLEAQLANLADQIAYNTHDVDDGLRADLLRAEQLMEITLFSEPYTEVARRYPGLTPQRRLRETVRRMLNALITNLIENSLRILDTAAPQSIEEVRHAGRPLLGFTRETAARNEELSAFLRHTLYQHPKVQGMSEKAARTVSELFAAFMADPGLLPGEFAAAAVREASGRGEAGRARIVADYIAGMTDRYALQAHARLHPAKPAAARRVIKSHP